MRSRKISAEDLLRQLLTRLFGGVTVCQEKFIGIGRVNPHIPVGYFATDRLKRKPSVPINKYAAGRLRKLLEITLRDQSGYESADVSKSFLSLLRELFGIDLGDFDLLGSEGKPRAIKIDAQLAFLDCLMGAAMGAEAIDADAVSTTLRKEASKWRAKLRSAIEGDGERFGYSHGVDAFHFRVDDVRYGDLIGAVEHNLDVIHFHGLTWTNYYREYLKSCLGRPGVAVRVGMLSPQSEFFAPFAHYISVDPAVLQGKFEETISIWKILAREAADSSRHASSIRLYATDEFPAKSMYRFDSTIVVTPKTNARPKGQFMSFSCSKIAEESAFDIFMGEIESVFEDSKLLWST